MGFGRKTEKAACSGRASVQIFIRSCMDSASAPPACRRRRRFRCGRGRPVDRWSQALFPGVPGDACMQRQQAGRQATGRPVPLHASIQPTGPGRAESADR